jgi:hypothetical protein
VVEAAEGGRRWHAALAYALLGRVPNGLREAGRTDLTLLLSDLDHQPGGLAAIRFEIANARAAGSWPRRPPSVLTTGLGPAQFAAALAELRRRLGVDDDSVRRVRSSRRLDADEQRLQAEVPPHHGG